LELFNIQIIHHDAPQRPTLTVGGSMKRAREEAEDSHAPRTPTCEPDAHPHKRKRWHVVKLVQRLLTNYFVAPGGLLPPVVGEPSVDWDGHEGEEEETQEPESIAVSPGKPEGRPLTHFFRPALSELHRREI
jgi:hypothetical protein